jgi:rhodanese-related sulfurtransferase
MNPLLTFASRTTRRHRVHGQPLPATRLVVGAFVLTAVLGGCGSDKEANSASTSSTTAEPMDSSDGSDGDQSTEEVVTELSPTEAATILADDPPEVILDVRTPEEYASGHIESAQNIDFQAADFDSKIAALDPSATTFVYCRSGNRSSQAVAAMRSAGFTDILHLSDGVIGWEGAGLPLVQD